MEAITSIQYNGELIGETAQTLSTPKKRKRTKPAPGSRICVPLSYCQELRKLTKR